MQFYICNRLRYLQNIFTFIQILLSSEEGYTHEAESNVFFNIVINRIEGTGTYGAY